jgi:hypothetical protein
MKVRNKSFPAEFQRAFYTSSIITMVLLLLLGQFVFCAVRLYIHFTGIEQVNCYIQSHKSHSGTHIRSMRHS